MKKTLLLILTCALLTALFPVHPVMAEELNLDAASVVLMDADSGAVLYSKDMDARHYPASITKIMTVYLALSRGQKEQVLTASKTAIDQIDRQSSHIWLDYGEEICLIDACYATIMASANDTSNVLAEAISGSQEEFAELMNETAVQAGAKDTHFTNAHGLPDENHYTTAYDMAMITRMAIQNEDFHEVFGAVKYSMEPTNKQEDVRYFASGNEMLKKGEFFYPEATGGKIGWTRDAGYTMVTTASKDNMNLIAVVMQNSGKDARYTDTKKLFDYGFANYKKIVIPASEFESQHLEKMKRGKLWAEINFNMNYDFKILAQNGADASLYHADVLVEDNEDPEQVKCFAVLTSGGQEIARMEMDREIVMHDISFKATVWPKIRFVLDCFSVVFFVMMMALSGLSVIKKRR